MKIIRKAVWQLQGTEYVKVYEDSFEYSGAVAMCCGPTGAELQIGQSQQNFMTQLQNQATQVFGNSSTVFNNLVNTFLPTVKAGPNQQGFSPTELSNLNAEAITQTGQQYKNAKAAVGNAEAAVGGGNTALPGGAQIGVNENLASQAANQAASELGNITEQNYATGRQNYENAAAGLAAAPGVFAPAESAAGQATGAGEAASKTATDNANQAWSWIQPVAGALGAVGGAAAGKI